MHSKDIKRHIERKAALNLSATGIFLISLVMIAREGVEVAIFTFAGKYTFVSIMIGILTALIFAVLIFYSLVKVNLTTIFTVTLVYLILQAGFLLGYGIHEGLSASKEIGIIENDNVLLKKAFDLSSTPFNHKQGIIGIPLYVSIGWYSKPEWIQFIAQYLYTLSLFVFWRKRYTSVT